MTYLKNKAIKALLLLLAWLVFGACAAQTPCSSDTDEQCAPEPTDPVEARDELRAAVDRALWLCSLPVREHGLMDTLCGQLELADKGYCEDTTTTTPTTK